MYIKPTAIVGKVSTRERAIYIIYNFLVYLARERVGRDSEAPLGLGRPYPKLLAPKHSDIIETVCWVFQRDGT
jgi:hypothetical protein